MSFNLWCTIPDETQVHLILELEDGRKRRYRCLKDEVTGDFTLLMELNNKSPTRSIRAATVTREELEIVQDVCEDISFATGASWPAEWMMNIVYELYNRNIIDETVLRVLHLHLIGNEYVPVVHSTLTMEKADDGEESIWKPGMEMKQAL